ncbi:hypothetical protein ENUP19_0121G0206 [Entamoeba nuttalli]|uniref:TLDc domain-containing protein n=2 Tax=Entamoeba nuttalli TaxID=412467 RepID=K2HF85_ENTNP|nr:hypothetical protein ENU1_054130 [Entamoeba nuttalli P19]EKE41499.1 hypothetical protein ENU1_054130 [Entamoeba nuttalli P19]|eukprot:XP_008856171.1 hypothetical protein ENU1_054130 [Entamoeba nuttalli P19]
MEEILNQLERVETKSAQQIEKIVRCVGKIAEYTLDDVIFDPKKDWTFDSLSTCFSKSERMMENKKEIIVMIKDLICLLDDLKIIEDKELDNLENDRKDLLEAMEEKIRDMKQYGNDRRNTKPPRSPIDDRRTSQRDYSKRIPARDREVIREDSHDRIERRTTEVQKEKGKQIVLEMRPVIENEIENVVANKSQKVLFDTNTDGWKMDKFVDSVTGKKRIGFLVFDEIAHVFGVFVNEIIQPGQWLDDSKLFLFSYTPGQNKPLFYSNIMFSNHDGKSIFKLEEKNAEHFFRVANVIYIQNVSGKKGSVMYPELEEYFFHANPRSFCGYVYPDKFESTRVIALQF